MLASIKLKQVAGVTALVAGVVVVLSLLNLARLASVSLDENRARAELLANAVYHRARDTVAPGADPYASLRRDPGLRSILESSLYSRNVTYAAIVDAANRVVAHADPSAEGQTMAAGEDLSQLLARPALSQLRAVYAGQGKTYELRQRLLLNDVEIGSIRVGISTLLVRQDLSRSMAPVAIAAVVALGVSVVVAMALAQLLLRPIHVISSGLTRLGRGEFGVRLDLDERDEFGELGTSFNQISERLSALRGQPVDAASAARYARKLAALGRLSAGVAHEVKNPLNAMMIHLELLRQQADAQALPHVDVIAGEIRRLDQVVQGFLKFSRPEEMHPAPVTLSAIVDEIVPIVKPEADRHHVTIDADCAGAPAVSGDAALLRQALLNLALNACQAMPDGGTLRIRASPAGERQVQVTVADTGVGIAPEDLSRVFNLYFTTKSGGSGIGLSMVYRTVQMHDGEIEVESTPGAGTTFRITLPRA